MTSNASICRSNMGDGLADGTHAVMTTDTGAQHLIMIHLRRNPRRRDMACIANRSSWHMRGILTRRQHTIVAIDTGSGNRTVIKRAARKHGPCSRAVTVADVTRRCRNDVRSRFAFRANAVMTTLAISGNAG